MADSYQKIIDDIAHDVDELQRYDGMLDASKLLVYKKRLEALQKNPMFYADSRKNSNMPPIPAQVKNETTSVIFYSYTIPLIRGD